MKPLVTSAEDAYGVLRSSVETLASRRWMHMSCVYGSRISNACVAVIMQQAGTSSNEHSAFAKLVRHADTGPLLRVRQRCLIDCVVTYLNSESHVGSPNLSSGRLDTFFICSKSASLFVARALNCSSLALDMRMMHENTPGYSVGRMWTLSTGQRHMTGEQTSHVHLGSPISP